MTDEVAPHLTLTQILRWMTKVQVQDPCGAKSVGIKSLAAAWVIEDIRFWEIQNDPRDGLKIHIGDGRFAAEDLECINVLTARGVNRDAVWREGFNGSGVHQSVAFAQFKGRLIPVSNLDTGFCCNRFCFGKVRTPNLSAFALVDILNNEVFVRFSTLQFGGCPDDGGNALFCDRQRKLLGFHGSITVQTSAFLLELR